MHGEDLFLLACVYNAYDMKLSLMQQAYQAVSTSTDYRQVLLLRLRR